jgi:ubiquinone/menaquinone biosynthesis C-methylase UbiE
MHDRNQSTQVIVDFQQPGHNCLSAAITQILKQIGLENKAVAQLCCNNGRELLSIKNLGAQRCVGFDISDNFIDQAQHLAEASSVAVEFVRCDVYDIPSFYDEDFDLVFISVGTLGWMPDLKAFFQVAQRLLKPDGWLVISETHPLLDMFESDDAATPPGLQHSYFRTTPYVEDMGLDYIGSTVYHSSPSYWFHHKMSDIIDGCLSSSLTLRSFQEYDRDVSGIFAHFQKQHARLPLSYTLVAQKA